ncbi:MAG: TonB-dependent receptor [Bacteroidales bacterium]|nr:TonB-dependent receptor [Bacteroidales bacterium]
MAQVQMSGSVKNSSDEPLVGVLLSVDGTSVCALTNSEGKFTMRVPEKYRNDNLIVSYYGYDNDTLVIKDGSDFNVVLGLKVLKLRDNVAVVTTQKRLQSSWEVPISLALLDFGKLDKLNILDPQELSLYAPGYHNQTQSGVYSVNVIRGVASDGSNSYSFFQPRISVFLDGVSITHMGTASTDIFDMQRAEVVKGPQGTLFGKGAEFGAISYVTNKPVDNFEAYAKFHYGSYQQKVVQAMVNSPIGTRAANRLAFHYNDRNGFNTNLFDGSELSGKGALSVRDIFRYNPTPGINILLSVDYEHNDEPCVSYKGSRIGVPDNLTDVSPYTPAYFNGSDLFAKRDMGGINYSVEHDLSSRFNYSSTTAIRAYKLHERYDMDGTYLPLVIADENQKGLQVSEEIRLNWTNLTNLTGFVGASYMYDYNSHSMLMNTNLRYAFPYLIRPTLERILNDIPDDIVEGVDKALNQVMSGYYKMLPQYADAMRQVVDKLRSVMDEMIRSQLAEEYVNMFNKSEWSLSPDIYGRTTSIVYDVMVSAINEVFASEPSASDFTQYIDPVTIVEGLGLQKIFSNLKQYSNLEMPDDYAEDETDINIYHEADVFADATYRISRKMFFTMGLRGTIERQKTSYCSNSGEAPLVGAFIYHSTNGETYWLHDLEVSWVGRAALNYLITSQRNIYLSVSKGRRPGSIYYNFSKTNAIKLKPETSINYELGLKGSVLKNHLLYSFAGYYYDWLHFQSSVSSEGDNGVRTYVNTDKGKAHAMGAEVSGEIYLPKLVSFFGDYSYIDARFSDKDSDGNPQELAGHRFRMTPEHTFDFGMDLSVPVKNKATVYFRPNISLMSDMYFSTDNTEDLWQDGYSLVNFSAGVAFAYKKMTFDLSVYGKNIFDQQYLIEAGNTGQIWGSPTFIAGAPAMFGVGLKVGIK